MRIAHFLSEWKTGKIIVLPKPGKDNRLPASYHPVILLLHVARLFGRLLLRRIGLIIALSYAPVYSRRICGLRVLLHVEKAFGNVLQEDHLYKLLYTATTPYAL